MASVTEALRRAAALIRRGYAEYDCTVAKDTRALLLLPEQWGGDVLWSADDALTVTCAGDVEVRARCVELLSDSAGGGSEVIACEEDGGFRFRTQAEVLRVFARASARVAALERNAT